MKIRGSKVAAKSSEEDRIAPRCAKYAQSVQRLKSIDLDAIGDRKNNVLLDFLRCQVKADKTRCQKESKLYENCHAGVMGIGNFEGRKNCGEELELESRRFCSDVAKRKHRQGKDSSRSNPHFMIQRTLGTAMPMIAREMRVAMCSSISVTPSDLDNLCRSFLDPAEKITIPSADFIAMEWQFRGGKEVLRVLHSVQESTWFERWGLLLANCSPNIGLNEAFSFFYLVEFPMLGVDFRFTEKKRVQFGQIKVSEIDGSGAPRMNIGGNNHSKEIWESKHDDYRGSI